MLTILVLVCSIISTPDWHDCVIATSLRHDFIGQTQLPFACQHDGMVFIAEHYRLRDGIDYPKVIPSRPETEQCRLMPLDLVAGRRASSNDFPSADDVAVAIVAAARSEGEDPIACAQGALGLRCRHYAMAVLQEAFPVARKIRLAFVVGGAHGHAYNPRPFWFNVADLNEIRREYRRLGGSSAGIVPIERPLGASVTAEFNGDPSPDRSALAAAI